MRVAGIGGGVVVAEAHDHRSFRPATRSAGIAVDVLPPEVPVGDRDQVARRAVGQPRFCVDATTKVVRVRLHGQEIGVHGQTVAVRDLVIGGARRNIDGLTSEPEANRRTRRRIVGEEQADAHVERLRLAGRLHVQLHDQIAAGLEPPGHAGRRRPRVLTGRPTQHVARRVARIGHHAADVPRFRVSRVQPARRLRAVDTDVRVMHYAAVPRLEFEPPHIARAIGRNRDHERAEDVLPRRAEHIRLLHQDDEVRLARDATPPLRLWTAEAPAGPLDRLRPRLRRPSRE